MGGRGSDGQYLRDRLRKYSGGVPDLLDKVPDGYSVVSRVPFMGIAKVDNGKNGKKKDIKYVLENKKKALEFISRNAQEDRKNSGLYKNKTDAQIRKEIEKAQGGTRAYNQEKALKDNGEDFIRRNSKIRTAQNELQKRRIKRSK